MKNETLIEAFIQARKEGKLDAGTLNEQEMAGKYLYCFEGQAMKYFQDDAKTFSGEMAEYPDYWEQVERYIQEGIGDNALLQGLLEKAIVIATKAHAGQVDKGGHPYILHPLAVMHRISSLKGKIVGVLHDTVEDTWVTLEYLQQEGFPEDILTGIDGITRREGETRKAFIQRASENELSSEAKMEDLKENMDLSRIPCPTDKDEARRGMYSKELRFLEEKKKASKQRFEPDYAVPPAETLKEMMEYRDVTLLEVKDATGIPYLILNEIMRGERQINEELAEKLGSYFGVPASFLCNLELNYRAALNRLQKENE